MCSMCSLQCSDIAFFLAEAVTGSAAAVSAIQNPKGWAWIFCTAGCASIAVAHAAAKQWGNINLIAGKVEQTVATVQKMETEEDKKADALEKGEAGLTTAMGDQTKATDRMTEETYRLVLQVGETGVVLQKVNNTLSSSDTKEAEETKEILLNQDEIVKEVKEWQNQTATTAQKVDLLINTLHQFSHKDSGETHEQQSEDKELENRITQLEEAITKKGANR